MHKYHSINLHEYDGIIEVLPINLNEMMTALNSIMMTFLYTFLEHCTRGTSHLANNHSIQTVIRIIIWIDYQWNTRTLAR